MRLKAIVLCLTGQCRVIADHMLTFTHRLSLWAAAPLEGLGSNPAVEDLLLRPGERRVAGRCLFSRFLAASALPFSRFVHVGSRVGMLFIGLVFGAVSSNFVVCASFWAFSMRTF